MTRGRRRGVLLALGACVVGLAGWFLLARSEGRLSSGRVDEAATQDEEPPSELDAPSLAAGAEAAAARRRPRAAEESALSDASTPAVPAAGSGLCTVKEPATKAVLVVTVEAPAGPASPSAEIELRLVDPWGRAWSRRTSSPREGKKAGRALRRAASGSRSRSPPTRAGGRLTPPPRGVFEGLAVGAYAVSAGTPGLAHPGWLPVFVTLSEEHETAVRLRPMLDAERGVIEVALLRGGAKIQGTFVASIRGRSRSRR